MGNTATKYTQDAELLSKAGIGAAELLRMLDTIKALNQVLDLEEAVSKVCKDTCEILSCDRCTIFLVDDIREQLVLKQTAVSGGVDIRIPWDKGLAGTVFQEGQVLNILVELCLRKLNLLLFGL